MTLQSYAGGSLAQPLMLIFHTTDAAPEFSRPQTANLDGTFTLSGGQTAPYHLFIEGVKWLQKFVFANATAGGSKGVSTTPLAGDINSNTRVSYAGYLMLSGNHGKSGDAPLPPPAPVGVGSAAGNGCAVLAWTPSSAATGYNVYRSTTSGSSYTKVSSNQTNPYYIDIGLTNGTAYYYAVSAVVDGMGSSYSAESSALPNLSGGTLIIVTVPGLATPGTMRTTVSDGTGYTTTVSTSGGNMVVRVSISYAGSPAPPTNFRAIPQNHEVVLVWDGSDNAKGYDIYRSTSPNGPFTQIVANYNDTQHKNPANGKPQYIYTDTELSRGPYYYGVSAVGPGVEGIENPKPLISKRLLSSPPSSGKTTK